MLSTIGLPPFLVSVRSNRCGRSKVDELTKVMTSFLKMISVAAAGGTVINYSKRFSLTGMTGTFPSTVLDGLTDPSNTDGPPSQNQIAGQGNRPDADGSFAVPYTLQTGPTRYAPMQPQPMTKILANKATPLWPTSSVPIAKTWLPPANGIKTTVTQSNTFSVASRPNDVRWETCKRYPPAPRGHPADFPSRPLLLHNPLATWPSSWLDGKIDDILYLC